MNRVREILLSGLMLAVAACTSSTTTTATAPPATDTRASATPITLRLIAFNDFHGQLTSPAAPVRVPDSSAAGGAINLPTGGVAWLAGLVGRLRAENPISVVVAAGDLIGASPMNSALFHDEPTIEALSGLDLQFSAVGNHEFDEGVAEIKRMQNGGCLPTAPQESCRQHAFTGAKFTYLAANVIETATGKTLFPEFGVKRFALGPGRSLTVGFIGAVVRSVPDLVVKDGIKGLRFLDEATAANAAAAKLRALGVDIIVLLIHEGGRTSAAAFDDDTCPDFAGDILPILDRLDPSIDVVVSGHTHKTYICRRNGRLVTSAGSLGRFVTDIELTWDPVTRHVTKTDARQLAVVNDSAANPAPSRHPTVAKNEAAHAIEAFYTTAAAPLANRTIAEIHADILKETEPTGESALGDLISDAHLAATSAPEKGGAQIAFMNHAGIRTDLLAATGRITYGQIQAVHPFGNSLITVSLTGAEIHSLLEQQWLGADTTLEVSDGFSYRWDPDAPPGSKVDPGSIRLRGKPLDPARTYRVVANEFLAGGGDGFKTFEAARDRVRGMLDAEALERYVAAHSPLNAPAGGRISKKSSVPQSHAGAE